MPFLAGWERVTVRAVKGAVLAFIGAKRFCPPFRSLERCDDIAFIAGEAHPERVSVSRPHGVRREAGFEP